MCNSVAPYSHDPLFLPDRLLEAVFLTSAVKIASISASRLKSGIWSREFTKNQRLIEMIKLSNFKIVVKVSLIVVLMAIVTLGTLAFATHEMRLADDANTDIVTRVNKSTTIAVRASRRAENYVSSAFQLAGKPPMPATSNISGKPSIAERPTKR